MKPFIRYIAILTLGLIAGYLIRDWQARNPGSAKAPMGRKSLCANT
jgi:hypothetical protein